MLQKAHLVHPHILFKFICHPGRVLQQPPHGYLQWLVFSSFSNTPLLISLIPAHSSCMNRYRLSPVCSTTLLKYKSLWNLLLVILYSISYHSPPLLDSEKSLLTANMSLPSTDDANNSHIPSLSDRSLFRWGCWREKHKKILRPRGLRILALQWRVGEVSNGSRVSSINSWTKDSIEKRHAKVCIQLFTPGKQ